MVLQGNKFSIIRQFIHVYMYVGLYFTIAHSKEVYILTVLETKENDIIDDEGSGGFSDTVACG